MTVILSVVLYGSETWSLTRREKQIESGLVSVPEERKKQED
jgi:hypothetical protein